MSTSNVLTNLIPTMYAALEVVNNEPTDLIDAVNMNSSLEQAYQNQVITVPITPPATLYPITPGALVPDVNGETNTTATISIDHVYAGSFKYNGEEQRQLQLAGMYSNVYSDQVKQRFRAIRNSVEATIAGLWIGATRAVGAAGTDPFGTINVLTDFAAVNKAFIDNGSPDSDRHLIINSAANYNLQGIQATLFRANEAGTDKLLRTGRVGNVEGLNVGVSGQIVSQAIATRGTGINYVANGAQAVGATSIVIKTGSGTLLTGDIVSFDGGVNQYVVSTGLAAPGIFTIPTPGLRVAVTNGTAMSVNGTTSAITTTPFTPNMAFTRDAITLIARQPLLPQSSGNATLVDFTNMKDPRTGLIYQVAVWAQYRQIMVEIGLAWGAAVINPANFILLLGK